MHKPKSALTAFAKLKLKNRQTERPMSPKRSASVASASASSATISSGRSIPTVWADSRDGSIHIQDVATNSYPRKRS